MGVRKDFSSQRQHLCSILDEESKDSVPNDETCHDSKIAPFLRLLQVLFLQEHVSSILVDHQALEWILEEAEIMHELPVNRDPVLCDEIAREEEERSHET